MGPTERLKEVTENWGAWLRPEVYSLLNESFLLCLLVRSL